MCQVLEGIEDNWQVLGTVLSLVVTFMSLSTQALAQALAFSGPWKPDQCQVPQWVWNKVQYCLQLPGPPAPASDPGTLVAWAAAHCSPHHYTAPEWELAMVRPASHLGPAGPSCIEEEGEKAEQDGTVPVLAPGPALSLLAHHDNHTQHGVGGGWVARCHFP